MNVGLVYDPFFQRHDTGASHPERKERLEAVIAALARATLLTRLCEIPFDTARPEALARVHHPAYVDLVRIACEQQMGFIGCRETNICPESYDVACRAAGGVLAACDAVMAGGVLRAFCAVRPPGHHAFADQGSGYCLFNNVAIAAEHLRRCHAVERVAIIDWDVHHGNGTQSIFEARSDVLFISLHETPVTQYPHTGYETECGQGPGTGYTMNCAMAPGSGDTEYRQAFEVRVLPALERFRPEFMLISAGFDAAAEDDIANIQLTSETFHWMTQRLNEVADRHGGGRVVSVLEGGYDLPSLGRCACEHVRALANA